MAGTSDYYQNKLVDLERGQAYAYPATIYVGLLLCTKGPLARSTAYALNDTVSLIVGSTNYLYKCTTAGTTAASAPAYTGTPNEAITDGTAVFTEQTAALQAGTAAVEPAVGGYARVGVAASLAAWAGTQGAGTTIASSGTSATTSNNAVITYPLPSATWDAAPSQIWGFATYDAASAGNLLRYGGLGADQIVNTGNNVSFAAGTLIIKLDNA